MRFNKILYSRASTGKIHSWEIEYERNKYRTITGSLDGKKTTSEWTECFGKNIGKANETSDNEQTLKEVESLYKKKIKREGYWENIKDIDKTTFIEPMLAKKYVDRKHLINWKKGIICQIKLNGSRCIATKQGLFSRKGERFISVPHIEQSLKSFFELYPDAVIDGELFNYNYRQKLNEIIKLCRKTVKITKDDLIQSEKLIKYYVYDGYGFEGMNQFESYINRKTFIDLTLKSIKYIELVEDHLVKSEEELNKLYSNFVNDAQEGAIIRFPYSSYENKRSNYLLKMKPIDDTEAEIIGIEEGKGNWGGAAKIINLKIDDKKFNASFKGSYEQAVEVLKNKTQWIGKLITIYYNGLTGLGTPNFAQFDINNYNKGNI